ncbi:MAG: glycogen/starch/alpha-glucan phosphorylase [Gemmataceae bacterium]|nr:glycogen/starch/alpha-glucan phosphorylase [Gemmataceae bacterium]
MATALRPAQTADTTPFRQAVLRHLTYSLGLTPEELMPREAFHALALAVRDRLIEGRLATEQRYRQADAKRLYYLSLEFLIGRALANNLANLGLTEDAQAVLSQLGLDLAAVEDTEVDAALGNGGLGRLAACFLDSLATLDLPGFGYGIYYEYGLFRQEIKNGQQFEKPDNWRTYDSPWAIERPQDVVPVPLYGRVEESLDRFGQYNPMWLDWRVVFGVPHDFLVTGYGGRTVNTLRLFAARASHEVDIAIFNEGDYLQAVHDKVLSETISKILYPSDSVAAGKELRLVQEYFLVACSVRDILRTYLREHDGFDSFPDKVAIQLNDTHPALTVAELMRILLDENDLSWERAWEITEATCAYTNHTLMAEALERWPVPLLEKVLPRHLQLIYEINRRFLGEVARRCPGDSARLRRMSLVEEGEVKQVRMANLAIVGSHSVNGVAAVHTQLVKSELVPDFNELWPGKFNNKTNGVTPRRWLLAANPALAALITEAVGEGWVADLDRLRGLERFAADPGFRQRFAAVKHANKERLASVILSTTGVAVQPDTLFDVQVKRIHEYKRQLLNLLHVVHEYLCLVEDKREPIHPRTFVFAGKAAPGYQAAKEVIRAINDVARVINNDARARPHLRLVFVPDYRVSLAEAIIPAADLSEQISTAGTEASGTSNMKFAMNGALTIGTLDGANIEIREEVGEENIFIFGLTVEQIRQARRAGPYRPWEYCQRDPQVRRILDSFREGRFCPGAPGRHDWIYHKLLAEGEPYLHLADLGSYLQAHDDSARLYQDRPAWAERAIRNVARVGKFSSDRTIREYARDIWGLTPVPPAGR